jgi:hypothetical protein
MTGSTTKRSPGVYQTDAPAGYIGIVLYDRTDRLVMRLEVVEEEFSLGIIEPLEEWARQHERIRIAP